ncbi:MAG: DegV family protein [Clostridiales bacterium]|nr:DegV family protein [Clostridiales bacterium]
MNDYVLYTDSACDLPDDLLARLGVRYRSLTFAFEGESEHADRDVPAKEFYAKMRAGGIAKTAAINTEEFRGAFEEEIAAGHDILYIAFSSGLSTTYNSGRFALADLSDKYPERKLVAVDSLCASAGFGLLVYLAAGKMADGATLEEVEKFVLDTRLHICHWFTVDDLVYLKRGGRISPAATLIGTMLGIKPVLHVDDEGHLVNVSKARGRQASIHALADHYGELALDKKNGTVFISHGDCLEDAETLRDMLAEEYGAKVELITDIGPVIGAHSGPGTLALFFVGSAR